MYKNSKLRDYIIKYFLITIVSVSLAESIISYALNRWIFPIMELLQDNGSNMERLTLSEISAFFAIAILHSSLNFISNFAPGPVKGAIASLAEKSENYVMLKYPGLGDKILWSHESTNKIVMLILFLVVILIIYLVPYILGIFIFSKTVIKKVREMEQKQEEARQEFDRKRNLLLSDIAHDLRTPITTISGYAKAINDGMITDKEKQKEYLDIIQSKSKRMNDLIELLFEYVKIDSEGFKLEKEEYDLIELLRENAALMYTDIEDAQMEFVIDIPEESQIVEVDKLQFSRVITNLIVNAIRHNEENTIIKLSLKKYPGLVIIDIADNGREIPKDIQENIFEPFSRGDKSRNSKGGTGLGLSIAQKIINMHGWEINLNTNYPEYTKAFEIKVPIS